MDKWHEKLAIYDKLISANPNFERKGKAMPYTSANGHMFSQLNKDGELGIRLSKESGEKFMEKYQTPPFKAYGAVMKEYVLVPEELYDDLELLASFLDESYNYVMSLKPKATKKK